MPETAAHKDQVLDQFTQQAESYSRLTSSMAASDRQAVFRAIVQPVPDDLVLDVCCGPAAMSLDLAPHVAHVTGFDLTPAMLDQARAAQARKGVANAEWVAGDVCDLPFEDGAFSMVLCGAAFHHLTDPRAAFAEMARVCRPGGRIIVNDVTPTPEKSVAYDALERLRDPSHVHALTRREMRDLGEDLPVSNPNLITNPTPNLPLDAILATSFPDGCSVDELRNLLREDALSGEDRHGFGACMVDGAVRVSYPMTIARWEEYSSAMELDLKGKRALVTGSSSGLGTAIARELAAEGVSVVIHGRDRDKSEAVVREIEKGGGVAALALGDLTDDGQADAVADAALAAFGGIDILVNNAGGVIRIDNPEWQDVSSDEWLASFNLNVVTIIRMAKRLSPGMVERGWGRIINISSVGGSTLSGRLLDYGSAKAALDHVTGNLSKNLAPKGVTVNAVIPGTMLTPQSERWLTTMRAQRGWSDDFAENERLYTRDVSPQPIPRLGRPAEIAAAVTFLASPRSDYTTGTLMRVDGGAKGR